MEKNEIIGEKYVIKLVSDPIDVNEAVVSVNDLDCGAVSLFMGNTRRTEAGDQSGRQVLSLDYEAYYSMALKEMQTIVEQNCRSNAVKKCYIAHRLGRVGVGQTSLLIACSAPHRTEAHEMVMKLLNQIKEKVPIWKKINYTTDKGSDEVTNRPEMSEWSDKSEAFWLKHKH